MIIARVADRLRLTTQIAHARLAGLLVEQWGGDLFTAPEPLPSVKLAAELHDEGWLAWERTPQINPDGSPMDFIQIPTPQHLVLYAQGIEIATAADPYAGLLVSLHGTGLYLKRHGHMDFLRFTTPLPEYQGQVEQFLATQRALQERLIAAVAPDPVVMWTHYRWLQCWDFLALFACMKDPSQGESFRAGRMPVRPGGAEHDLELAGVGPDRFRLTPWPFKPDRLELTFPVRYLPSATYADHRAYQEAYSAAPEESVTVTLEP